MDKQLDKAICNFWSDLRSHTTEELYAEYVEQCEDDGVKPRPKSVIIREACEETGCAVEVKQIKIKYFVPGKVEDRQEWQNYFEQRLERGEL